jgi:hypothetical protein
MPGRFGGEYSLAHPCTASLCIKGTATREMGQGGITGGAPAPGLGPLGPSFRVVASLLGLGHGANMGWPRFDHLVGLLPSF